MAPITLRLLACQFALHEMASVLLKALRILHLARHYIVRISSRWALLIALLGRRLSEWQHCWSGKPCTSRNTKPAESSIPGNRDRDSAGFKLYSVTPVSPGPAISREYVVATSTVPESANQGSLHERAEGQSATASSPQSPSPSSSPSPSPSRIPATLPVDQSWADIRVPDPRYLDEGNFASRNSSNVSVATTTTQSRASERRSIITSSHESLHAPVGQPSARLPRSPHHQFGRGPDASRSGGRSSRSPSPIYLLSTTQQPYQPDIVPTIVPTDTHAAGGISPTVGRQSPADLPSSSSNTQEPERKPTIRSRRQRTTSIGLNVQRASEEDLSIVSPINLEPWTEEPMAVDSPTHLFVSSVDSVASEFVVLEGRFLQLIHSEQVPRYTKHVTMQVYYTIIFIQSLHGLTDPGPNDLAILSWSP